ncbi:hypothetical protein E3N88_35268 [Mikania micrantha]|uniref:DUF1682 domain-containing protein n=1 Tax=Mikania micrantha TaxID=192012 RepID=A0A5N6M0L2_9ASTR|nr:hypothetical protein E3N88_35268 [Mikania micrantha]
MANPRSSSFLSSFFSPRGDTLLYLIALLSIFSLLFHHLSISASADSHFEGFDADEDAEDDSIILRSPLSDLPRRSPPPPTTLSTASHPESDHGPPTPQSDSDLPPKTTSFDYWDEDEFEGFPTEVTQPDVTSESEVTAVPADSVLTEPDEKVRVSEPISLIRRIRLYVIEIICVCFLITFTINYFTGRKENETLALAWVATFATRNSIFEKNFSLLGVGEGDDSPLLLKEGQNVFKFYASGRRFCEGLVATMDLKSRHDLIARLYNMIVPCKDEIVFEVFGEKAFEKFGKWFISMHFSDQQQSTHRKVLVFKFALPDANHMVDMTRLVALVPYYIDLIGRYKLSSQARSKTEAARSKVAQEVYKELQNARQEALQKKKAERRKMMEEAESKLNAEALRKKEAKERARQLKKAMPKIKMSRVTIGDWRSAVESRTVVAGGGGDWRSAVESRWLSSIGSHFRWLSPIGRSRWLRRWLLAAVEGQTLEIGG